MKTSKTILTVLLTLALAFGLLAMLGTAAGATDVGVRASGECGEDGGNLHWTLTDDGVLTISGGGRMKDYYYKDTAFPIRKRAPWYDYAGSITSVVIETNVNSIGEYAFFQCGSLRTVQIPQTVTLVGECAFDTTCALNAVYYMAPLANWGGVGIQSSNNCLLSAQRHSHVSGGGTSVVRQENRTEPTCAQPGGYDSVECCRYCDLVLANSHVTLNPTGQHTYTGAWRQAEEYHYRYCDVCRSAMQQAGHSFGAGVVMVPATETETGVKQLTCSVCGKAKNIVIPALGGGNASGTAGEGSCGESVWWTLDGGGLLTIFGTGDMTDFVTEQTYAPWYAERDRVTDVRVVSGVTSVGRGAFSGCANLGTVSLPDTVKPVEWTNDYLYAEFTSISTAAFAVDEANPYLSSDENGVLFNKAKTVLLRYPLKKDAVSYTVPNGVVTIGRRAFVPGYAYSDETGYYADGPSRVILPDSLRRIDDSAFMFAPLTSIQLPDDVNSIGQYAFESCRILTSVTLSRYLQTIEKAAFWGCINLESIVIPEGVTEIGEEAFYCAMGCVENPSMTILSFNCDIYDSPDTIYETVRIRSYRNFTAAAYAGKYNRTFENLGATTAVSVNAERTKTVYRLCETIRPGDITLNVSRVDGAPAQTSNVVVEGFTPGVLGAQTLTVSFDGFSAELTVTVIDHDWSEWTVTTPASFLAAGERTRECVLCHTPATEPIPALTPEATATDAETGVSVVYTNDAFEGEVTVTVTPVYDGASYELINNEIGNYRHALFDITTAVNGSEAQPAVPVLVRIPLPADFSADHVAVYHVTPAGLEETPCVVADGYICFEAGHFSVYAIADKSAAAPSGPDTPDTPEAPAEPGSPASPGQTAGKPTGSVSFFAKIAAFFAKIMAFFRGIFK